MECADVREVADSFLAEELLTETNHQILRHLDRCPECRADLAARRALRDGVRGAVLNARDLSPTPEFMAELQTRLRYTADRVPARRRIRFHGWWALAATVLLTVALGLAYQGRDWITATGAIARAAVGDHRYCGLQSGLTGKPISLEAAAQQYDVTYRVLEKLPPSDVMTPVGAARVLERHVCSYGGRRFAHIVIAYRGERVSLLVTSVNDGAPSAAPGEAPPRVTSTRVDGTALVSFRAPGHMVFFAGNVAPADLVTLADTVAGPLFRGLAGV